MQIINVSLGLHAIGEKQKITSETKTKVVKFDFGI